MNRVVLIGNLAADPESRTTQSGITQCTLRLAVQRRFVNQQTGKREADFIPVVCWRQTADFCARYLSKGRKIAVEGSLQTRSYDAQDGSKRYVTEVIADNVEFCDARVEAPQNGTQEATEHAAPPTGEQVSMHQAGFEEIEEDDLPF